MRIFLYRRGDSFLHRLNPLSKLAINLLYVVLLSMIVDPVTPGLFAIVALIAMRALGGVSLKTVGYIFVPLLVVSFGTFWSTSFFFDASALDESHLALRVGPVLLTYEALDYGLTITLRLIAIFMSSMMFVLTTDPTEFIQSLIQQLRVSFRFGYGILAAYRFVPMLQNELANIRAAHKVRGFDESRGIGSRISGLRSYTVPLLAITLRKAGRVALAMDSRGFATGSYRTYYHQTAFGQMDYIFIVGAVLLASTALAVLAVMGLLGDFSAFGELPSG